MRLTRVIVAGAAMALWLTVATGAAAWDPDPQKADPPSGGTSSSGGIGSAGGGSSSGSSGGGSSSGGSSGGGGSISSGGFDSGSSRASSPRSPRSPSSGGQTNHAVGSNGRATSGPSEGSSNRAIPRYSRNRGDNEAIGAAVVRGTVPLSGLYGYRNYYSPYYNSFYSRYSPYYYGAFGLGYFYYDPWWGGGYGGYPGYESGYGGGGSTSYSSGQYRDAGAIRMRVKPRDAQVYVDGYYVGLVDDFDGAFQKLTLDAGPHRVEIRATGHESVVFDVQIVPGETVQYKRDLARMP